MDFYGLREAPFGLTPDPEFFFWTDEHREVVENLLYGITHRQGFLTLIGDIGTGKTTTYRTLLQRLNGNTHSAVILNPDMSEQELLKNILKDLGVDTKGTTTKELIDELNVFLLERLEKKENVVLIIDEAQNLPPSTLEQVRMLSNLETTKQKLIQILLVGQVELQQKLEFQELRQLNQRIAIRTCLSHLSKEVMENYIKHRLKVAGYKGKISFTAGAFRSVFKYTQGVPRMINLLCDRILMAGYVEGTTKFSRAIVRRAIKDLTKTKLSR
ncbi:MAG TPA: AAA family ATPase [Candidatus Brocadiales bacterium]|nr:AAA family ATPase [Candidatus Brocadiales bacterium]